MLYYNIYVKKASRRKSISVTPYLKMVETLLFTEVEWGGFFGVSFPNQDNKAIPYVLKHFSEKTRCKIFHNLI